MSAIASLNQRQQARVLYTVLGVQRGNEIAVSNHWWFRSTLSQESGLCVQLKCNVNFRVLKTASECSSISSSRLARPGSGTPTNSELSLNSRFAPRFGPSRAIDFDAIFRMRHLSAVHQPPLERCLGSVRWASASTQCFKTKCHRISSMHITP